MRHSYKIISEFELVKMWGFKVFLCFSYSTFQLCSIFYEPWFSISSAHLLCCIFSHVVLRIMIALHWPDPSCLYQSSVSFELHGGFDTCTKIMAMAKECRMFLPSCWERWDKNHVNCKTLHKILMPHLKSPNLIFKMPNWNTFHSTVSSLKFVSNQ